MDKTNLNSTDKCNVIGVDLANTEDFTAQLDYKLNTFKKDLKADKLEYWEKSSNLDNITLLHVDLSNTADSVAEMEYKLRANGTISTCVSAINENTTYVDKPTPKVDIDVSSLPSAEQFIKDNASSVCWYTIERWSEPKYRCPKCNEGAMRKDQTMVLTSNPPQYHYQCDKCGHVDYHHY